MEAGRIGEKGLPGLEKAFNIGNSELQKVALYEAGGIEENALPLLIKVSIYGYITKEVRENLIREIVYRKNKGAFLLKGEVFNNSLKSEMKRDG